jgi:hypothetical protein
MDMRKLRIFPSNFILYCFAIYGTLDLAFNPVFFSNQPSQSRSFLLHDTTGAAPGNIRSHLQHPIRHLRMASIQFMLTDKAMK